LVHIIRIRHIMLDHNRKYKINVGVPSEVKFLINIRQSEQQLQKHMHRCRSILQYCHPQEHLASVSIRAREYLGECLFWLERRKREYCTANGTRGGGHLRLRGQAPAVTQRNTRLFYYLPMHLLN